MNEAAPFTTEPYVPGESPLADEAKRLNGVRRHFDAGFQGGSGEINLPPPRVVSALGMHGKHIPPRRWIVPNWLPVGVVTGLYGDGGLGKSLLAQQLQTATALALPWLGLPVEQLISLGVYAEDSEDELARRQADINSSYGCNFDALADVHWMPRLGEDNLLMTFGRNGAGELTRFHGQLVTAALDHGARLVVVDTAADVFAGNENDRGHVRQFVSRALGSLAQRIDGAVLLCAHPSRSGLSTGEGDGGSTGWSNSLRSRLFLTTPELEDGEAPDGDARVLHRRKANYAARADEIRLRWRNGCIVVDEPTTTFSNTFGRRAAEDVFLDLVDAFARENQRISESRNAGNYAPAMFAKRREREGYRRADFERAMQILLSKGELRIAEYGSPSNRKRKIERAAK